MRALHGAVSHPVTSWKTGWPRNNKWTNFSPARYQLDSTAEVSKSAPGAFGLGKYVRKSSSPPPIVETSVVQVRIMSNHYHAIVWIDHHEAKLFQFDSTDLASTDVDST